MNFIARLIIHERWIFQKLESWLLKFWRVIIVQPICCQEKALKWELKGNPDTKIGSPQIDGLTTNGVLILNPDEKGSFARSTWREVSICGHVYTMRDIKNKTVVHRVSSNDFNEPVRIFCELMFLTT